jgi:HSP90 family molecular chaperone
MPALDEKQNITLRLSRQTLQKARVLAAQRSTSISGLLTSQIEKLAGADDEYERAMKGALALMEEGFDLGGVHKLDRDALHER